MARDGALYCTNCGAEASDEANGIAFCLCSPAMRYCSDWCRKVHWTTHSLKCPNRKEWAVRMEELKQEAAKESDGEEAPIEVESAFREAFSLAGSMNYTAASEIFWRIGKNSNVDLKERFMALCAAAECFFSCDRRSTALDAAEEAAALANELPLLDRSFALLKFARSLNNASLQREGHYERTIDTLQEALLSLKNGAVGSTFRQTDDLRAAIMDEMAEATRIFFPKICIRMNAMKGLVMEAAVDLMPGTMVASEAPLLVWKTSEELFNPSLFQAFSSLGESKKSAVLSLHCPSLPPSSIVFLHNAAAEFVANHTDAAAARLPLGTAIRLAVASKCNSHSIEVHGADGHHPHSCFLSVMSKVSHSCAPNMMYDGATHSYFTTGYVNAHEELTFSYSGKQWLLLGTHRRQRYIFDSYMFRCCCERCSATDFSRGIKCDMPLCRGVRRRTMSGPMNSHDGARWSCDSCNERWADTEMPLQKESALEEEVLRLAEVIENQPCVAKNQYEELKGLLVRAMETLGEGHWTYLLVCSLFTRFFQTLAVGRAIKTRIAALTLSAKWLQKFLRAVNSQRIIKYCPAVAAEALLLAARHIDGIPELFRIRMKLLQIIWPFFASALPDSKVTEEIRGVLSQTEAGLPDSKVAVPFSLMPEIEVEEEEGDLVQQWEDYLVLRVTAAMGSQQNPQLPASIRGAMARGTS